MPDKIEEMMRQAQDNVEQGKIKVKEQKDWKLYQLPTHPDQFYEVFRFEFDSEIEILTEKRCNILMLVSGSSVRLETQEGKVARFNYAETFVVPAVCTSYRIVNEGKSRAMLLQVFVRDEKS